MTSSHDQPANTFWNDLTQLREGCSNLTSATTGMEQKKTLCPQSHRPLQSCCKSPHWCFLYRQNRAPPGSSCSASSRAAAAQPGSPVALRHIQIHFREQESGSFSAKQLFYKTDQLAAAWWSYRNFGQTYWTLSLKNGRWVLSCLKWHHLPQKYSQ